MYNITIFSFSIFAHFGYILATVQRVTNTWWRVFNIYLIIFTKICKVTNLCKFIFKKYFLTQKV